MLKKRSNSERPSTSGPTQPSIPAEAALSFLKDTKGAVTWSVRDLADTLKINRIQAEQVIALLQAQGYVQPARGSAGWVTSSSGETVSGAVQPRFTRESVEEAIAFLKGRIKEVNGDRKSAFKVTDAVAFGDFLRKDRTRMQAANVGIGLSQRDGEPNDLRSAPDARAQRAIFRKLRGKTALLHIRPYVGWMSKRSHHDLL